MVGNCELCQSYKYFNLKYGKLQGYVGPEELMKHLSSDIVGPYDGSSFKKSNGKNFGL